jgi:hypothetical protein
LGPVKRVFPLLSALSKSVGKHLQVSDVIENEGFNPADVDQESVRNGLAGIGARFCQKCGATLWGGERCDCSKQG